MIRINLLPVQHEAKRQFGRQQLILGFLLVAIELVVLFLLHGEHKSRLNATREQANNLQVEVDQLNERVREADRLRERKGQLESFANVLQGLEANRAGPVSVLDDLKSMLNRPYNDLQRVAQERRGWNTHWNPTSVWLSSFEETDGNVKIRGSAMTNDDVAEFAIRLASSRYFTNVRLNRTQATNMRGIGNVFEFEIASRVNYGSGARSE